MRTGIMAMDWDVNAPSTTRIWSPMDRIDPPLDNYTRRYGHGGNPTPSEQKKARLFLITLLCIARGKEKMPHNSH